MNYFFSYQDAVRFANEVDCWNVNSIPQAEKIQLSCSYTIESDVLKPFFIEGVSEVVPVYCFRQDWDYTKDEPKQTWYYDYSTLVLKNVITGDLYSIWQTRCNSRKFKFSLFYDKLPRLEYFKTDLVEPNQIGKATRKKLQDWFEYLGNLYREQLDYINRAKCANKSFTEKVLAKFPDARVNEKNGWVSSIYAAYGPVDIKWEASESGRFYRSVSVSYTRMPKDEVILA